MENHPSSVPENLVLFDGVCNLCNGAVNFLIDIDKHNRLRFTSLQSGLGQHLGQQFGLAGSLDTFIFVRDGQFFVRSQAALEVLRTVGGWWQIFYVLIIVPRFIRDGVYRWVARNRYRWFGKLEACRIPTPALRAKFL
ncbi:MAG: thiol-disulfide oxidoreductase DCC family protein [Bernardetiaceae bacterium]|jgi:predicted DCC family thiol-disulfide oxidoreductase YuxK|nr:thiol-disulfide oxidoreductase DCC family protein [Bernardetiaceae bacterium]